MSTRALLAVLLALLGAVLSNGSFTASAQGSDDIVSLVSGCQIVALSAYSPGSALSNVTAAIAPTDARPRLWFYTTADNSFALYGPISAERSAKSVLDP